MHWADEVAQQLVARHPDAEIYTCASGISPSGPVHIGNFREVITTYFVVKALRDLGKKVRFIYSWDSYDRFRKVSSTLPTDYSKYLGMPYSEMPDPFGKEKNFETAFEKPMMKAMAEMSIDAEYIFQSEQYKIGRYVEGIIHALKHRKEIYDIEMSFKTQEANNSDRENYYPLQIYCQNCGHDFTKVTGISEDCTKVEYECKCGHKGTLDLNKDFCVKLPWKVDWPMRWGVENVLFEPGGRDHSSEGGSYQVSSEISRKIFHREPPLYRMYDFINLKGQTKKISSSSGTDMTPSTILKVYQPEILLWMFTRFLPEKGLDIALDTDVLRTYHEFDRMYATYKSGEGDDIVNRIMELALANTDTSKYYTVDASLIASFAPIVNFDLDLLTELFHKIGQNWTKEQIQPRFEKIKYWLENYCPEQIIKLLPAQNSEFISTITDEEKQWIARLVTEIETKSLTPDEMQTLLYDIPKINNEPDKTRQKRFFEVVYNLLLGKTQGPRLYLFLTAVDKKEILRLLKIQK